MDKNNASNGDLFQVLEIVAEFEQKFKETGNAENLDAGIRLLKGQVGRFPVDHFNYSIAVHSLGLALQKRFDYLGASKDLDDAIDYLGMAAQSGPQHTNYPIYLLKLSAALEARISKHCSFADLNANVEYLKRAEAAADKGSIAFFMATLKLGLALALRFEETIVGQDIDDAAEYCKKAMIISEESNIFQAGTLTAISAVLRTRFEFKGDPADLNFAIDHHQRYNPTSSAEAADIYASLSGLFRIRYERAGNSPDDLNMAIEYAKGAALNTPDADSDRPLRLSLLAGATLLRSYWDGFDSDLDVAIEIAEHILSEYSGLRDGTVIGDAASCFVLRFARRGDIADLNVAISALERALACPPSSNLHQRVALIANYARALEQRFNATGSPADINRAIDSLTESLEIVPVGHTGYPLILDQLGSILTKRYAYTDNLIDLNAAIGYLERSEQQTHARDFERSLRSSHLGEAFLVRSRRVGSVQDLDLAINFLRASIEQAAEHEKPHVTIANLGAALLDKFDMSAASNQIVIPLLNEAIRLMSTSSPTGSQAEAGRLDDLGRALSRRFSVTHEAKDSDSSIECLQNAADLLPSSHPARIGYLVNLASSLAERSRVDDGDAYTLKAIDALREASQITTASPYRRAYAALYLGRQHGERREWGDAAAAYQLAIEMLSELAPGYLTRVDQEYRLEHFNNLASDAAACFINMGDLDRALSALDQGRTVLLAQAMDNQIVSDELSKLPQHLSLRFEALAKEFDAAETARLKISDRLVMQASHQTTSKMEGNELLRATERCRVLSEQKNELVSSIRAEGFEDFLRPPSFADLLAEGESGPIIFLNASRYRCDALVISNHGIKLTPFSEISYNDVVDKGRQLGIALGDALVASTSEPSSSIAPKPAIERIFEIYSWLWMDIVYPIVRTLGYRHSGVQAELPRIWWILTGPFSLLPIHAAEQRGADSKTFPMRLSEIFISSYAPSVRVLRWFRNRKVTSASSSTLIVALPDNQDPTSLRWADTEAQLVAQLSERPTRLPGIEINKSNILSSLQLHSRIHFACHAGNLRSSPSETSLVLGHSEEEILSVRDISQLYLPHAELAVLSACATGRPDVSLLDESIHLSSAFQMAGYSHVVSTLWPIEDHDGLLVVAEFYWQLYELNIDTGGLNVAVALHHCSEVLRSRYPEKPWIWSTHIHSGA